jgi:hypothetical protein
MGNVPISFIRDPGVVSEASILSGGTIAVYSVADRPIPVVMYGGSVAVNLNPGDITIGSVNLSDGVTGDKARVLAASATKNASTTAVMAQCIDASGNVLSQTTLASVDANTVAANYLLLDMADHAQANQESGTRQLTSIGNQSVTAGETNSILSAILNAQGTDVHGTVAVSGIGGQPLATQIVGAPNIPSGGSLANMVICTPQGQPVHTRLGIDSKYRLAVSSSQLVLESFNNSSTANLAYHGSFVGSAEETTGFAGIQTNLNTDQNCTIYIDQSPDGVNWDIQDSFNYYSAGGGDSTTTQATSSYFRVRVINDAILSSGSTSYFRLSSLLCPVVEAVPRALENRTHALKVYVTEGNATFGVSARTSPLGNALTALTTRLVGEDLAKTSLDTNFWTASVLGNGTASCFDGQLEMSTDYTSNGTIAVTSIRNARYISGSTNAYQAALCVPTTNGTCTKRRGAYNAYNGFFFEFNGNLLTLVCRKNGSDAARVNSGNFNGVQGLTYILDSAIHVFEIFWTHYRTWFIIDDRIIHQFDAVYFPLTSTLDLPVSMEVCNIGGNSQNNKLDVRVAGINRFGPEASESIYKHINTGTNTLCKIGPGKLHKIICGSPTNSTVTVYDNTTANGPVIAALSYTGAAAALPTCLDFNTPFFNGLTLNTSATIDLTVIYE